VRDHAGRRHTEIRRRLLHIEAAATAWVSDAIENGERRAGQAVAFSCTRASDSRVQTVLLADASGACAAGAWLDKLVLAHRDLHSTRRGRVPSQANDRVCTPYTPHPSPPFSSAWAVSLPALKSIVLP